MEIDKDKSLSSASQLRRRAEDRLKTQVKDPESPLTENDTKRLVHELEVHQLELEMQNTELRQARDQAEVALEDYTDLYDFAPVGYFTIDRDGIIRAVNLTGASILGVDRSRLIGQRFGQFVTEESRKDISSFLGAVIKSGCKESCDLTLQNRGGDIPLIVQIEAIASASGEECRLAVINISERKQAEEQIHRFLEELCDKNQELIRFNSALVEREIRMIELKKEVNELCIQSGKPPRYPLEFEKKNQ